VFWTQSDPQAVSDAAPVSPPDYPMAATFDGTWGAPARLDPTDGADTLVGNAPIARNSSGHFVVTWTNRVRKGTSLFYDVYAARLAFGGAWSSPILLNTPGSEDGGGVRMQRGNPVPHVSENGTAMVHWIEVPGASSVATIEAVHFAPATGWSAPARVAARVFGVEVSGTMDHHGNGTVVWRSADDFADWAVRYTFGVGWETPERISTGNATFTSSAVGANGEVVAMWHSTGGVWANVYR
jgi:hypothetical protein